MSKNKTKDISELTKKISDIIKSSDHEILDDLKKQLLQLSNNIDIELSSRSDNLDNVERDKIYKIYSQYKELRDGISSQLFNISTDYEIFIYWKCDNYKDLDEHNIEVEFKYINLQDLIFNDPATQEEISQFKKRISEFKKDLKKLSKTLKITEEELWDYIYNYGGKPILKLIK